MLSDHAFYCSVGARPTLALGFTSGFGNHKVVPPAVTKASHPFVPRNDRLGLVMSRSSLTGFQPLRILTNVCADAPRRPCRVVVCGRRCVGSADTVSDIPAGANRVGFLLALITHPHSQAAAGPNRSRSSGMI